MAGQLHQPRPAAGEETPAGHRPQPTVPARTCITPALRHTRRERRPLPARGRRNRLVRRPRGACWAPIVLQLWFSFAELTFSIGITRVRPRSRSSCTRCSSGWSGAEHQMSDMASIGHALWLHEDLDAAEARHEVKAHLRSRRVSPWRIERAGGRAGAGQRPTPLEDQVGAKSSAAVCDFFSVTAELRVKISTLELAATPARPAPEGFSTLSPSRLDHNSKCL